MFSRLSLALGPEIISGAGVGLWAAAIALAPSPLTKMVVLAPPLLASLLYWLLGNRNRWLTAFFAASLLLPPLPFAFGNSGPHVAPLFGLVGLFVLLVSLPAVRLRNGRLLLLLFFFCLALLQSLIFAALYSGPEIALLSVLRIGLFALAPLVFVCTLIDGRGNMRQSIRLTRIVFRFAICAALFACIDFYFQFPSPAGYSPQFVWLPDTVLRRAQGLFYEASTLGNFCAFFLVFVTVALFSRARIRLCSRTELWLGGVILSAALIFSYSRGSLLNLLGATAALVVLRKRASKRWLVVALGVGAAAAVFVYFAFPAFSLNYWQRLQVSFLFFRSAPEAILSGRPASWRALLEFLMQRPAHLLFGIGYKTLPYSSYIGSEVIADNTYLSLLVETGIIGFCAFLALNFEMLRSSLRAARSSAALPAFFGTWFFCFWIGELLQMFSGDLITYWRVLPLFFWVLAVALRESDGARPGIDQPMTRRPLTTAAQHHSSGRQQPVAPYARFHGQFLD